ncbi:MAG: hypothetical protein IPH44_11120 [Myxococcales bacterium]|nr:hypothetical protein [Myxococcales bacterium]MBK7196090.1 hypothetical protein [Myxococcales bacterium]MBP6849034.1 hypothetical protein [Kofleriaceae bacterium]
MPIPSPSVRTSFTPPAIDSDDRDWTTVLVGSDAAPLARYIRRRFRVTASQPCLRVDGRPSMLERTLELANRLTPPTRTLTVLGPEHADARAQVAGRSHHVLQQPLARDPSFGLYVALAMIRRWAPRAVVTVLPGGHHVDPPRLFVSHLATARALAEGLRDRVVLLGAEAGPAGDAGAPVAAPRQGGDGRLRSASGLCARVDALWALARATVPRLVDVLEALGHLVGTEDEADAIDYIYRAYRPLDLVRDVIARAPERCVTLPLAGVTWTDVASPAQLAALVPVDAEA